MQFNLPNYDEQHSIREKVVAYNLAFQIYRGARNNFLKSRAFKFIQLRLSELMDEAIKADPSWINKNYRAISGNIDFLENEARSSRFEMDQGIRDLIYLQSRNLQSTTPQCCSCCVVS